MIQRGVVLPARRPLSLSYSNLLAFVQLFCQLLATCSNLQQLAATSSNLQQLLATSRTVPSYLTSIFKGLVGGSTRSVVFLPTLEVAFPPPGTQKTKAEPFHFTHCYAASLRRRAFPVSGSLPIYRRPNFKFIFVFI